MSKDEQPAVVESRPVEPTARELVRRPVHLITTLGRSGPVAATGRTATRATKASARAGYTVAQGGASWARRAAAGMTHAQHRDQIRAATATGDKESLKFWVESYEKAKDARMKRLVTLPRVVLTNVLLGVAAVLAVAFLLLLGGAVVGLSPGGASWSDWWGGVGTFLELVGLVLKVVFWVGVVAGPAWLLFLTWLEGRRAGMPPPFLMTPAEKAQHGGNVTPSRVVLALRDLGLPTLKTAIKEMGNAGAGMLGPIRIAGCGVEVDVTLPSGVSTVEIQAKRRKLAENLDRHGHELFITIPPKARTVRLWVADPGALDEPIGASPLVMDPTLKANTRTGRAPWGDDLRGDARGISVHQRHVLVTGLSNQGKTAALRALALWVALDPVPRLWIADLKGPKDWAMFDGLAERLIIGPTDEHVIAATEMLEDAVAEMERRTMAGGQHPPLFVIVDEAQVAYMCPATDEHKRQYGGQKNTSRYFTAVRKIHNQGRAVDVTLWEGTQDPTNANLPKLTREGKHIRAALVVGTEAQSQMALGEAAVAGGAAPHELRQGQDKGTLVVAGDGLELAPGDTSVTLRTHFIDDEPATEIAERAKQARARKGSRLRLVQDKTGPDHLAAIHEAMRGEQRVRTAVLLGRLIEADAEMYEPWGHGELKAALDEEEIPIRKSHGDSVVRQDDVEAALGRRETGTG